MYLYFPFAKEMWPYLPCLCASESCLDRVTLVKPRFLLKLRWDFRVLSGCLRLKLLEAGFTSQQKDSLYPRLAVQSVNSRAVREQGGVTALRGLYILFSPRAAWEPTDTCYRIPRMRPERERGRTERGKQRDLGEKMTECKMFPHTQAFSSIFVFWFTFTCFSAKLQMASHLKYNQILQLLHKSFRFSPQSS